eukprot:14202173-Heterocapsa_arctica.AAC.1
MSRLQRSSVGALTERDYADRVARFQKWAARPLPSNDPNWMSCLLGEYFDFLFFEGEALHLGTKTLAA